MSRRRSNRWAERVEGAWVPSGGHRRNAVVHYAAMTVANENRMRGQLGSPQIEWEDSWDRLKGNAVRHTPMGYHIFPLTML